MGETYVCGACKAHFRATGKRCPACGSGRVETSRAACRTCGGRLVVTAGQCPRCGSDDVERASSGRPR